MRTYGHFGVIIGKFYPPTEGHHYLIDTAAKQVDQLIVVAWGSDVEEASMPLHARAEILRERHPNAAVFEQINNLPVDYNSREVDRQHAGLLWSKLVALIGVQPLTVFSSEKYGERLAADLSDLRDAWSGDLREGEETIVSHVMVDPDRVARPISASKVRENPVAHWDYLGEETRAYLTKRFVVCGAESTGTTTLTQALADRYQTVAVPEYGRTFSEATRAHHRWTSQDFEHIVYEQHRLEDNLARLAGPAMFCDTDGLATSMFHELYMGAELPVYGGWSDRQDRYRSRPLYIVTDPTGVPFEQDGYRLFEHQREWAHRWFLDTLGMLNLPFMVVSGSHEARMRSATREIDKRLTWDFATPLEYQ